MSPAKAKEGVVFGQARGRELHCDIYSPDRADAPLPAVLLIHGGGGQPSAMQDFGLRLGAEGFVCIAPEYRLPGQHVWPTQIENIKAAIRWCRSQAGALGADAARIAAMGFSAGGIYALLAAGTPGLAAFSGESGSPGVSETLAAVVAVYPAVLFYAGDVPPEGGFSAKGVMGETVTPEQAHAASPLTYAGPDFPPTFLIHGTADTVGPPAGSRLMYDALVRAGVPAELHLYAGQPHGFARQPEFVDLIAAESTHFLHRQLGGMKAGENATASVTP